MNNGLIRPETGNEYLLTPGGLTWDQANAWAQSVGGNLVTINDAGEQDWIFNDFRPWAGAPLQFWLGMTDNAQEGNWQWISGQPVTYTNWHPGEPNNQWGNEDYAVMINWEGGKWNDAPNSTYLMAGLVEIETNNAPPTDLSLSTTTVDENVAANTIVGNFSTTDTEGGTFIYELVSGDGSTDNAAFTINDNQLKINSSPNFENKSSYSIRVKTTDAEGLSYEKAFIIGVNDVNGVPSATGETVSTSKNTGNPVTNVTVELSDNVSDPDSNGLTGATLTVTSTSNGAIASIDQDAQLITFTPTAGFSGTASFKYTINDDFVTL